MESQNKAAKSAMCALSMIASVFSTNAAFAETTAASDLEIGGYVDMYYQLNMNSRQVSNARVYDNSNNVVRLQMAELSMKKKVGGLTGRLDLATGAIPSIVNSGDSGSLVTQAFFTYVPEAVPQLTFTAGKFYTWVGLEVVKSKDNWNYSRSLTFNYAIPVYHQGAGIGYTIIPEKFSATAYFVNGVKGATASSGAVDNKEPGYGLNLNATPVEGLTANYNLFSSNETNGTELGNRMVHDLNATYKINDMFAVAFDVTLGNQQKATATTDVSWTGWAVYGKITRVEDFHIALRYEMYDDKDGFTIPAANAAVGSAGSGTAQKISSITGTLGYQIAKGFETRLEYRMDKSDKNVTFVDKDNAAADNESTFTAALLASF